MATIASTFPTLVDVTKRLDPQGNISRIAEVLSKYMPILDDMAWVEGNLPTGHRYTSRSALPGLTWRRFNQGVDPTVSKTEQYDEPCGMLEGYSKVDVDLAKLNGNEQAFRYSEDQAFVQAMNIEVGTGLFYHSVASAPEKFTGLTPRLNSSTANDITNPMSVSQLVLAEPYATVTDLNCTSVWLVGWSPETVFGIFPKGSVGGLQSEDLGRQLILDSNNKQFLAYVTRWQWKMGLVVRDFRYLSRIANIDTSRWKEDLTAGPDLAMRMQDAYSSIFNPAAVRLCWYMNRATYNMLNKQLVKRQANWLEWIDDGRRGRIPAYMGVPIKFVDTLLSTESKIQ
jgi:hypothetical protein